MLTGLVEQPGGNRMAFEYLTTWYLLKGQLPKVVQQVEQLGDFGYTEIPPLCQEAILIYSYGARKSVDLQGRAISSETDRRFKHFSGIVKSTATTGPPQSPNWRETTPEAISSITSAQGGRR